MVFFEFGIIVGIFVVVNGYFDEFVMWLVLMLCLFVFVFIFLGCNWFNDYLVSVLVDVILFWLVLFGILLLCGYVISSLYYFEDEVLIWWVIIILVV